MYIVNDIELLGRLNKHRVLPYLVRSCAMAISAVKYSDYTLMVKQLITDVKEIAILYVNKDGFDPWIEGRRKYLTIGDLSSIYLAVCNPNDILVLSPEDVSLEDEAKRCAVPYIWFDDFFIRMIKDENILQLYNLIKAA